jgi:hypothetical protein
MYMGILKFNGRCYTGGTGDGSHTYSTTEQVVGTLIDGSPVYEKTAVFDSELQINANSWATTTEPNSNIESLIAVTAISSTGTIYSLYGAIDSGNYINLYNVRTNAEIRVKTMIYRYTKSST